MEFAKIESFLRTHWPAAVIVLVLSAPAIWTAASIFYAKEVAIYVQQVSALKDRLTVLEVQVEDLEEYKMRAEKLEAERKRNQLTGGIGSFSPQSLADSLYTRSDL